MKEFTAPFIKSAVPFSAADYALAPAPIFIRKFNLSSVGNAEILFCPLGYGYCYINGQSISNDLFVAPLSEYDKFVWYNRYNVSHLLKQGENVVAVILGNGFFNENFPSSWDTNKMPWRDGLKFALQLKVDGKTVLESDENFKCRDNSFVTYNQLRSGETFDARLYNENWKTEIDDNLPNAVVDEKTSLLPREECFCPPIREFEEYDFVSAKKTKEGYLLDFGVNISGYVRLCVNEAKGTEITLHHAEQANEDGTLKLNRLNIFYPTVDFQVDRYVCGEKSYSWAPKFTYHGFRFVLVKGLTKPPKKNEFKAVFVHQAVDKKADFSCSNTLINKIYDAGVRSSYSNMHYALTDCPTREKLGWTNDAASSFEQLYINFDIKDFMEKWATDTLYNMDEKGKISAVIPPYYDARFYGPLCDGFIFKLPQMQFRYLKDKEILVRFLPFVKRYYDYLKSGTADKTKWLDDWDGHDNRIGDPNFMEGFYTVEICRWLILASKAAGEDYERFETDLEKALNFLKENYLDEKGKSVIDSQTVISALLSLNHFEKEPLINQLKARVEKDNFHLTSGMFGLQYVFGALFENGAADYAFKLITATGHPSFDEWFKQDATTLWETWEDGHTDSKNHHMLSGVIAWFFKGFLGINPNLAEGGFENITLTPCFVQGLDFCNGYYDTYLGRISAKWERVNGKIKYTVCIPKGINATFEGNVLKQGENIFYI